MTDKKISDEKLLQEIRKGKTEKEIAYDNGYAYPSNALNKRIRNLGYTSNQKVNVKDSGAGQFYLGSDFLETAAGQKGFSVLEEDKVFFQVEKVSDGKITLEMTTDSFREVEE